MTACRKEADLIDAPLQVYLDNFKEEASFRGITVDYSERQVEARLQLHDSDIRLGWCDYQESDPDRIVINTLFWEILDDLEKEKLVFHELGHCVLKRPHLDVLGEDGRCKSIMHSGQKCSDNYTQLTRAAYLDELFLRR